MADYAIHEETLTDIADAIRKNERSVGLIDPADFASRIGLMGMLPKGKASGAIAHITDGADDVPTSSCEVEIAPTLTGFSSVSVVRQGKNLANFKADNYVEYQKCTASENDGVVTISASGTYARMGWSFPTVQGLSYTLSFDAFGDADYNRIYLNSAVSWSGQFLNQPISSTKTRYTRTFIATSNILFMGAYVTTSGTSGTMSISNVQLEVGSTASAYEAFVTPTTYTASLGRTVYGGSADIVNGTGTDENAIMTLGTDGWTYYPTGGKNTFNKVISDAEAGGAGFLSGYTWEQVAYISAQSDKCFYFYTSGSGVRISIRDDAYTSLEAWQAHIDGSTLVYPKTPEPFTFDGVEVPTRLAVNNFFSDVGDTELEYRKDINLALGTNKYRYLKWVITATRTTSSYCQMSDIEFSDANGSKFTFPTGTTVTADTTATSGTGTAYIIDGNTSTKFCGNWKTGGITITIDLGIGTTIDVTQYNKFSWYTANDANDRDPITWELYGIDVSNSPVLLCSRTAYTPTTDRKALADTVNITSV